jgi:hypothetical protein
MPIKRYTGVKFVLFWEGMIITIYLPLGLNPYFSTLFS